MKIRAHIPIMIFYVISLSVGVASNTVDLSIKLKRQSSAKHSDYLARIKNTSMLSPDAFRTIDTRSACDAPAAMQHPALDHYKTLRQQLQGFERLPDTPTRLRVSSWGEFTEANGYADVPDPSNWMVKVIVSTDIDYHMPNAVVNAYNVVLNHQIQRCSLDVDASHSQAIEDGAEAKNATGADPEWSQYLVEVVTASGDCGLSHSRGSAYQDFHIFAGRTDAPPGTAITFYMRTDADYLIGQSVVDDGGFFYFKNRAFNSDGTAIARIHENNQVVVVTNRDGVAIRNSWSIDRFHQGVHEFRLVNRHTGEVLERVFHVTGLLQSYHVDASNVLYARTYTYDQAVAIIVACNLMDYQTATRWTRGLLRTVQSDGRIPFGVYSKTAHYYDAYYRTGQNMWCYYALAWYLRKFPTSPLAGQIIHTLVTGLDYHIEHHYKKNRGLQSGLFTGGTGLYSRNYSTFDADHVIPWCSTEHNIDAYFALSLSADILERFGLNGRRYGDIAERVGNSLINKCWNPAESFAYQGIGSPTMVDTIKALDCGSWYSMVCASTGNPKRQDASLASCSQFNYPGGYTAFEYTMTQWGEGTAGVVLARRNNDQEAQAMAELDAIVNMLTTDAGILYVDIDDPANEMIAAPSLASTAWALLSMAPDGFWQGEANNLVPASAPGNMDLTPSETELIANEWLDKYRTLTAKPRSSRARARVTTAERRYLRSHYVASPVEAYASPQYSDEFLRMVEAQCRKLKSWIDDAPMTFVLAKKPGFLEFRTIF